jgi:hypothetical protein
MRSIRYLCTFAVLAAVPASCPAQSAEWRAAAKDLVNFTTDLLQEKAKEDKAALQGLKKIKTQLLGEKQLDRLALGLKKATGKDEPSKDTLKGLKADIKKRIENRIETKGEEKLLLHLRTGKLVIDKSASLPWPFGDG